MERVDRHLNALRAFNLMHTPIAFQVTVIVHQDITRRRLVTVDSRVHSKIGATIRACFRGVRLIKSNWLFMSLECAPFLQF